MVTPIAAILQKWVLLTSSTNRSNYARSEGPSSGSETLNDKYLLKTGELTQSISEQTLSAEQRQM